MVTDLVRGGAWTRAILGLPTRELHLCGEPSAVHLIRRMLADIGEELEVSTRHTPPAMFCSSPVLCLQVEEYDRLAPLNPLDHSLNGQFSAVRPGDCVVAFSRSDVYQIRTKIELATGQPCAIVYGALPAGEIPSFSSLPPPPPPPPPPPLCRDAQRAGRGIQLTLFLQSFSSH